MNKTTHSRRDFLKTGATGITASAVLGFPAPLTATLGRGRAEQARQPDRSAFQKKSSLFIGTQYFRPPNPRQEDWDRDLRRVKETGLELLRVWLYWAFVNPRPGVWVWDEYDKLFSVAEKNGLKVLLQLIPETVPYWLTAKYPGARYVDKDGRPVEPRAETAMGIGGCMGACPHNQVVREANEEFMRRVASRYRERKGLYGYDPWNEVWLEECYCNATQALFQNWLKTQYHDIAALNGKYVRSYPNFSDIRIPGTGVFADMFDYAEFRHWVKADHLRWRVQTIQSVDPDHFMVCHWYGQHPFRWDSDIWSMTPSIDKWGTSCYVGDRHLSFTATDIHETALQFNGIRDSAQGKPWWVAEMTGGSTWFGWGNAKRSDADIRLRMTLAVSFGAEGLVFWQWRPEIFGQEAPNFGLTGLDGELTSRTELLRGFSQMLNSYKSVFDSLQWSRPQVGLVWDPRGAKFEHFSLEQEDEVVGWQNFRGFYGALIDQGFSVEILNARLLAESGVPEGIKVIFAPFQPIDRLGLSPKLKTWVEQGGMLVAGPMYGTYGADTYANRRVPPPEIAEVFGARKEDTFYPLVPIVTLRGTTSVGGLPPTVKGQRLIETYQVDGAEVLGTWEEKPAFTSKRFGQGRGLLCGSFLGVNYSLDQAPELGVVVMNLCELGGVIPEARGTEGAIVRVARSGQDHVVFLCNPFDLSKEVSVAFSEMINGPVIDLLTGREMGRVLGGKPLQLRMEPKDAKVLLCKAVS